MKKQTKEDELIEQKKAEIMELEKARNNKAKTKRKSLFAKVKDKLDPPPAMEDMPEPPRPINVSNEAPVQDQPQTIPVLPYATQGDAELLRVLTEIKEQLIILNEAARGVE